MVLLASCSLEESKKFSGKLELPNEDSSKPDKVLLNIVVKDGNSGVFSQLSGNEECITFVGEPLIDCPQEYRGKVFNETNLDAFANEPFPVEVKGVTTLVRLPDNYSDMRTVKNICEKYPSVRFIGGNLLGTEGVRVGRYDKGKDKMSPVFNEMYDTFVEVNLNDLEGIQEKVKKTRKRAESIGKESKKGTKKKTTSKSSTPKPSKRVAAFSKMFQSGRVSF